MPAMKTKPASCLSLLSQEIRSLRALDNKNQAQFATAVAKKSKSGITKTQLYLLTEAVFFAAFRSYEQFLRNVFLLYCCGKQPSKRKLVRSYLQPRSLQHAESLVQSSMPFLDWSSPDTIRDRAEAYLKDGYPMKVPITTNIERLRELKTLRNHIAHISKESLQAYKKVIKGHFATIPLQVPRPGEFLLLPSRREIGKYYLQDYMQIIENVASSMTGI